MTRHVRAVICLSFFAGALSVCAQESLGPVKFLLDDGRKEWGILVEEDRLYFVLATSKAVKRIPKKSVQVPGTWTPICRTANDMLLLLDKLFDDDELTRIEDYQRRLQREIQGLESAAAPLLRSAMPTPNDRKGCLQTAIAHYKARAARVPLVLKLLEAIEHMRRVDQQIKEGLLPRDLELIDELMRVEVELFKEVKVPRRRMLELEWMRAQFATQLSETLETVRKDAEDSYLRKGDPRPIRKMLAKLRTARERQGNYNSPLSPLVDVLIADLKERLIPPLKPAVDRIFTFSKDRPALSTKYVAIMRAIGSRQVFLGEVGTGLWGDEAQVIQGRIQAADELATHHVETASERRALIVVLLDKILGAELALRRNQPELALVTVQEIIEAIQVNGLPREEILPRLQDTLFVATAASLVNELRNARALELADLKALVERTDEFLKESGSKLKGTGMNVATFENLLRKLRTLYAYRSRYAELSKVGNTAASWGLLDSLNQWVEEHRNELDPIDLAHWEKLFAESASAAQAEVERRFIDGAAAVTQADVPYIVRLARLFLRENRAERAVKLVNGAIQGALNPAVRGSLIVLQLSVAEAVESNGDVEGALDLCRRALSHDKAFAIECGVHDQLFRLRRKAAKSRWATGEHEPALEDMITLARDYPKESIEQQFYDEIISYHFKHAAGKTTDKRNDEWLVLNGLCRVFPKPLAELKALEDASLQIRYQLGQTWGRGAYIQTYEKYLEMEEVMPHLFAVARLWSTFLADARHEFSMWRQSWVQSGVKLPPAKKVELLRALALKYPVMANQHGLDSNYVELKIPFAERFADHDPAKAFEIYDELIRDFPDLAIASGLTGQRDQLRMSYELARIKRPLQVRSIADWVAVGVAVVLWLWLALGVISGLRERGHAGTRFFHFGMTFSIYVAIQATLCLLGFPFIVGFAVGFILPGAILMTYALRSCRFFPLIYFERWIAVQELLCVLFRLPIIGSFRASMNLRLAMQADIRIRERDLTYVHDYSLYRIHRATVTAQTNPGKSVDMLKKLGNTLEHEIVKGERWNERYHMCMRELGNVALTLGNAELTIECFMKDLETNPENPDVFTQRRILGELLFSQGKYDEASQYIRSCLATQGGSDKLWYQLGRCHFEAGRPDEAGKCFNSMLERTRDALFFGARAFFRSGERAGAIEWYQLLLKRDPNDTEAIYYMASCFAHQGQDRKAIKLVGLIPNGDRLYSDGQAVAANLLLRAGKTAEAEGIFTSVLADSSDCIPALLGMGQVLTQKGEPEAARRHFQSVLAADQNHPSANFFMGTQLEGESPDLALQYFKRAGEAIEYTRLVENYVGRIHFFKGEYNEALRSFERAESTGEQSPWFLYFYAYTLAILSHQKRCEAVLLRILGRNHPDKSWQEHSVEAMYSIGVVFFEQSEFKLALRCFEFVAAHRLNQSPKLAEIIEETRFRLVIGMLAEHDYDNAEELIAKLQIQTHDANRSVLYQYYLSLCHLYQGNYTDASATLTRLMEATADNVRFLYHLTVAEFGMSDDIRGMRHLRELSARDDLPGHLSAGLQVIQAYLNASRGNLREGADILGSIEEIEMDFPGVQQVRKKVIEAHLLCLCHLRDNTGIQELVDCLPAEEQGHAAYYHALAAVGSGAIDVAIRVLKPHVETSQKVADLYRMLAADAAGAALDASDYVAALDLLSALPAESDAKRIAASLRAAVALSALETGPEVSQSIETLSEQMQTMEDPGMRHTFRHNLNTLYFILGTRDEATASERLGDTWKAWQDYWIANVMNQPEYWSGELALLDDRTEVTPELAHQLTADVAREVLAPVFRNYTITNLGQMNESGINRHLSLLEFIAARSGQMKEIVGQLNASLAEFLQGLGEHPHGNTWDMQLSILTVQARMQEMLGTGTEMEEELKVQRKCRSRYKTPQDYKEARQGFIFDLLGALQAGADGDRSGAAKRLVKLLRKIPPGIPLGRSVERLHTLREAAANPELAAKSGVSVANEFRKMYSTIKRLEIS